MNTEHPHSRSANQPGPDSPKLRHRHRGWRIVGWSILGFVCFVLAAVIILGALINTDGEHRAIMSFAKKEASKALGVQVRIQDIVIHLTSLSADVYGITVAGAASHPTPPLLQVEHAQVGVRIVSLLRRKWYLANLRIDHPVARIYVDPQGVSNIPSFPSTGSSKNNVLFTLGIRHALLDRGEVYYNNRPSTFAADLRDLDLRAGYSPAKKMYSGRLAYADGALQYGAYQPLRHKLDVSFRLTPTTLQVNRATVSSGDSQVVLSATLENYNTHPSLQAHYSIAVDGSQFRQLLHASSIPMGFIHTTGSLQFEKQANQTLLQSIELRGSLSSRVLVVRTAQARVEITHLSGEYSLDHGDASLHQLRAAVLGGELTAQGTMTSLGGNSHSNFHAALHNVSLAQLKQEAGSSTAVRKLAVSGILNATAQAAWGKTMANLSAQLDATIRGQVASRNRGRGTNPGLVSVSTAPAQAALPVKGEIHAVYTKSNGDLTLSRSYLRTMQTALNFNGTIAQHSSLAVRLHANDLRELSTMILAFRPPASGQAPVRISGTASFNGTIRGSVSAPHIRGLLTAENLQVNGSAWKLVRANIHASPDHAAIENAQLESAPSGNIGLTASARLRQWHFSKQSPVQLKFNASRVAIANLLTLTGKQLPVTGVLNGNMSLQGSITNPQGSGNIHLTSVTAYQQPVKEIHAQFSGDGNEARARLAVDLPAGGVQANVTVQPKQRTYTAQITSPGIRLSQLTVLKARNIKAGGVLSIHATGQGSFDNPELAATIQSPSLTVANQTVSALKLQLNAANHIAHLALSSIALNSPIDAEATVHLTGNYLTDARLSTPVLSLQPILAVYFPAEAARLSGQVQIQAAAHGPLKDKRQLSAKVTLPVLNLGYGNTVHLAEAAPIQVTYAGGVIDVPRSAIRGTDTDLTFQGRIPIGAAQPMSLQLRGMVNLQIAQMLKPGIQSSGQVRFNIDSHGALAKGADLGEVDIVKASFSEPSLPVGLQNGNGVLKLTTDHLNVENFEATAGGGKVRMQGGVQYRPHLAFALGMSAKGVRVLYPQGMRENINANIRLDGSTTRSMLSGNVDLADLSFTPAFDLTSFAGQLSGGVEGPPSQGFAQNMALNLNVHSGSNMNLTSRELSIDGAANLRIRGTAAQPVILGRINLNGGYVIFNGNRFLLSGGTIQFINPVQTEPVLNLSVNTTIQQYQIDMRFQGPVTRMQTEYSSNPALPQADIIHLLAFGSTTEAAANNPTPANQEAESLVASQVSSQLTSRISKAAGISQLSISPVLQGGAAQGPAGAVITVRQRVTGNLFVTFSTNVAAAQDEVIQGEYKISPRVSLSATRDESGGFGLDVLIKKSW